MKKKYKIVISESAESEVEAYSMGEAVAIFPAIVPTFLIWTDPYLLRTL